MKQKLNFRVIIFAVLVVVALVVVFIRRDQLVDLVHAMEGGDYVFLALAIICQFGKYVSQSFAYANAFNTVGEPTRARPMFPLIFASYFMNVIAPSFNTAGILVVVDDARKRGVPTGRATSAALLMQITVITGFLVIMFFGFAVLTAIGRMNVVWFFFGMIVVFMVGIMVGILYIGSRDPAILVRLLMPLERLANRISRRLRKGKTMNPWAEALVSSFSEAGRRIREHPDKGARAFGFSILASTCELGCFCFVGLAFGLGNPGMLIGGYVVATLFSWVTITPQGVGVVEIILIATLTAYGINSTVGAAVALVYRGIVFWMPFIIGAVLIHRTKAFRKHEQ